MKQPVKTIVVKSDGVYVSHLEKPIEPKDHPNVKSGMDQYSEPLETNGFWLKLIKDYEQALSAFTSSLIKVENPNLIITQLYSIEYHSGKTQEHILEWNPKEGAYPAPDGLVMDIEFMPLYCMDGKECICDAEDLKRDECPHKVAIISFLPDKEEEKEIKDHFAWLTPEKAERLTRPINWQNPKSELKEDVGEENGRPDATVEPKDFATNLGGFQITIIPNVAISEGKPIMMMNPIDYDKYKESFLPNPPKA
jgi:hypothetical protein